MRDTGYRYLIRSENGTLAYVGRVGNTLSASIIKFQNRNGALKVARRLELRTKKKHLVYPVCVVAPKDANDPSSGTEDAQIADRTIPLLNDAPSEEESALHRDLMERPDDVVDKIDYETGRTTWSATVEPTAGLPAVDTAGHEVPT